MRKLGRGQMGQRLASLENAYREQQTRIERAALIASIVKMTSDEIDDRLRLLTAETMRAQGMAAGETAGLCRRGSRFIHQHVAAVSPLGTRPPGDLDERR